MPLTCSALCIDDLLDCRPAHGYVVGTNESEENNMNKKEYAMIGWRFEKAQKMLGTTAIGKDFLKVWNDAGLSEQTRILTEISNEMLELDKQHKVPHKILQAEIAEEADSLNAEVCNAFGDERGAHEYIRFEYNTWNDRPVKLEVNWSCCGSQDPKVAMAFAEALLEASKYAKSFRYNGYTEVWD